MRVLGLSCDVACKTVSVKGAVVRVLGLSCDVACKT